MNSAIQKSLSILWNLLKILSTFAIRKIDFKEFWAALNFSRRFKAIDNIFYLSKSLNHSLYAWNEYESFKRDFNVFELFENYLIMLCVTSSAYRYFRFKNHWNVLKY